MQQQRSILWQTHRQQQQQAGEAALKVYPTDEGVRVREKPVDGKPVGQVGKADALECLDVPDVVRAKVGKAGEWLSVRRADGLKGYVAAQFVMLAVDNAKPAVEPVKAAGAAQTSIGTTANPTPASTPPTTPPASNSGGGGGVSVGSSVKRYLKPTDNLNVRQEPNSKGAILTKVSPYDYLEILDADAASKLSNPDAWIQIKTQTGVTGHVSAKFVKEHIGDIPKYTYPCGARSITGMNLDMWNPQGHPPPGDLGNIGWIRVKFNVSYDPDKQGDARYGNQDIGKTYNRVRPFIEPYVKAGAKVLMVFTHQLYGEGAGFFWPSMNPDQWKKLTVTFARYAGEVAKLFKGSGLVHVYQIWNEQDTRPQDARAAVPIPASDYAHMFTETYRAIKASDPNALIITGGHTRGPDEGGAYARATLAALPGDVRPDGIASHPYGRGVKGHKFSPFGALSEEVEKYGAILPGKPVWFTEWGVLDKQDQDGECNDVTAYSDGFINIIKNQYNGRVAAAMWYAWADGMDNGYGLVRRDGRPRDPLYSKFKGY